MNNNHLSNADLLHNLLADLLKELPPTVAGQVLFASSVLFFAHQANHNPKFVSNALLHLASHSIPLNSEAIRNLEAFLLKVRATLESHQAHEMYHEIYHLYKASPLYEVTEIDLAPRKK